MNQPYGSILRDSPSLRPDSNGRRSALANLATSVLEVTTDPMVVCTANAYPLATNQLYRELADEIGNAPIEELVRHAIASDGFADVEDEVLGLVGRATNLVVDGSDEAFVVSLSHAHSGFALAPHEIHTLRNSLEQALQALEGSVLDESGVHDLQAQLTTKEREVFRQLVAGLRVSSIARSLHVSDSTVRSHLKSIFRKSGVHSQAQLLEKLHHTPQ